jgi:uncharacterized protein (DUF2062 family)
MKYAWDVLWFVVLAVMVVQAILAEDAWGIISYVVLGLVVRVFWDTRYRGE